MVLIISQYVKPIEAVDAMLARHREFLDRCYQQSKFIFSGPQVPRVGGVILANVASVNEARQIMEKDPFYVNGISEHQYIEFSPIKYDDRFLCFIKSTYPSVPGTKSAVFKKNDS